MELTAEIVEVPPGVPSGGDVRRRNQALLPPPVQGGAVDTECFRCNTGCDQIRHDCDDHIQILAVVYTCDLY